MRGAQGRGPGLLEGPKGAWGLSMVTFMILMNFKSSRSLSWAFSCSMMMDRTLGEHGQKGQVSPQVGGSSGLSSARTRVSSGPELPQAVPRSPVRHVVEVLRELCQVGALLLILLFCPEQNLGDLQGGQARHCSARLTGSG